MPPKEDSIMLFPNTSPLRRGKIYTSCLSVDIDKVRYGIHSNFRFRDLKVAESPEAQAV